MYRIYFLIIVTFVVVQHIFSQDLRWEPKKPIPNFGREGSAAFIINDKLYVGLGFDVNGNYLSDFWEYDSKRNTWLRKKDFPAGARLSPVSFAINNKGYVGLGLSNIDGKTQSDLYEYNPANDSWIRKANFVGGGRISSTVAVVNSLVYLGMGSCGGVTCYNQDWYTYNPISDTWKKLSNWPGGEITGAKSFVLNTNIYVGFGFNSRYQSSKDVYCYNTLSDTWSKIADFPAAARYGVGTFVLGEEGYVACGTTEGVPLASSTNQFYKYSPLSNSWSNVSVNLDFPEAINVLFCANGDTLVYATTGGTGSTRLTDLWKLKSKRDTCDYYDTIRYYSNDTVYKTVYTSVVDTLIVSTQDSGGCGSVRFSIYPNPTAHYLYVHTNKLSCFEGSEVQFIDQLGRILVTMPYTAPIMQIDIFGYARELYFIRLIDKEGKLIFSKKIVVHD